MLEWEILRKLSDLTYEIKDCKTCKTKIVHVDQLKQFLDEDYEGKNCLQVTVRLTILANLNIIPDLVLSLNPQYSFIKQQLFICLLSGRGYIYLYLMCIVNMLCTSKLFTFKYIHVTIKSLSLFIREGIQ